MFHHDGFEIKSTPKSSTHIAKGMYPSYQSSLNGRSATASRRKKLIAKGVASPESHTDVLYNNSSQMVNSGCQDGFQNKLEDPVDFCSETSVNIDSPIKKEEKEELEVSLKGELLENC